MADSLFDNRYRYDYIYPRGRSGETLRAVDIQDEERAVVIKRPAPNDAPPIRAGQEVSILNERKALSRLAGQQAVTKLLGNGQFFVGGIAHQYIVMERAEGAVVADLVLELAARGERLPELEMLVVVDRLLEVLSAAHAQDIIYNDVDAKHLFWDRMNYRLKIIDWGNAIFLEGDESTPQGISRQSDIYQVGELLHFILSGGGRIEIPRDAGDDFRVDFGMDADRIHSRLQTIVTRAVHPVQRNRYRNIDELRKELTAYREPIERERNNLLGRVTERLKRDRSKDELFSLLKTLEPTLAMDPGYPAAVEARLEILNRLSDVEVGADLDAARIYLESGNWSRAIALLEELGPRARGQMADVIALLSDWSELLLEANLRPTPPAVLDAVVLVFEGHAARAANLLLTQEDGRPEARALQWLLAERVSAHLSDVLLLRPNLYRLSSAMEKLIADGVPLGEQVTLLREIQAMLDELPAPGDVSLIVLRDRYRTVVDRLATLNTLIESVNSTYQLPNHKLPVSSLERAQNAAMALADYMHVIGKQATASPRDALAALDSSRAIEPANPVWDMVSQMLDGMYEMLDTYQIYVPSADGSDLDLWLSNTQSDLEPFTERLFDEMLVSMVKGLQLAERAWTFYANAVIQGNRAGAVSALTQAIDSISSVSPALSGWLNQLRSIIQNANYIERHALYGGLGRALADGWEAYDRGRLADAERLGGQAFEIARNDPERFAARRLRDLSEATRGWVERNGISDAKRTQAALGQIEALYTSDELGTRDHFNTQMPSKETYLKAMGRGLVELFGRGSTAASRVLFFNYLLLGTLDAHEGEIVDAEFWREAANRTLGDLSAKHPAARALDEFMDRRRDLQKAQELLSKINGPQALATLDATRKALEENAQNRALAAAVHSLREVEAAVRDWSDGEFRAAGIKLENALKAVDEVETQAQINASGYRAWLTDLIASSADLHNTSRGMMQAIESKPDSPKDTIRAAHHKQVDVTTRMLGEAYAAQLRQWRDTYDAFLAAYTDRTLRRSARLSRFGELFRAMFIDRHPAYSLYRHWYDLTEHSPEFPAPATDEPTPQAVEDEPPAAEPPAPPSKPPSRKADKSMLPPEPPPDTGDGSDLPDDEPIPADRPARRRSRSRLPMFGLAVIVVALVVVGVIAMAGGSGFNPATGNPTPTPLPGDVVAENAQPTSASGFVMFTSEPARTNDAGILPTDASDVEPVAEATGTPFSRALPTTAAPATEPPATEPPPPTEPPAALPTDLPLPSETPLPTLSPTPSPTVPPEGLSGEQDLLALAAGALGAPWTAQQFSAAGEPGVWHLGAAEGTGTGGDVVVVPIPPDLLEAVYGNNAASRIQSVEATLALTTYTPELVPQQEVYFGAVLASANDPSQTMGMQVVLNQPGVINLGQRQGSEVRILSTRSVTAVVVQLRLVRDPVSGVVTVFYNNEQVGQPVLFVDPNEPVVPVLFVRNGGVIVSVTEWSVMLRP